jgi:hypothetical protein
MKKLIATILAITLCMCAFTGCSYSAIEQEEKENSGSSMFVRLEKASSWHIVYHKETKVMYAVSRGGYNAGNFTLMVNPDGTPQIWDGE